MDQFLIRASAALVGSLAGALAAFGLAAWRLKAEERHRRALELKKALFVLILQRTELRSIAAQQLAPVREHPMRPYVLRPMLAVPPGRSVALEPLAYLLGVGGGELLNRLTNAESRYRSVVAVVEARNEWHQSLQLKLEEAQRGGLPVWGTIDDIRQIAGPVVSKNLEQLTDDLYAFADDAIRFNGEVCTAVADTFRRVFPKENLFGVEDLELAVGSQRAA